MREVHGHTDQKAPIECAARENCTSESVVQHRTMFTAGGNETQARHAPTNARLPWIPFICQPPTAANETGLGNAQDSELDVHVDPGSPSPKYTGTEDACEQVMMTCADSKVLPYVAPFVVDCESKSLSKPSSPKHRILFCFVKRFQVRGQSFLFQFPRNHSGDAFCRSCDESFQDDVLVLTAVEGKRAIIASVCVSPMRWRVAPLATHITLEGNGTVGT